MTTTSPTTTTRKSRGPHTPPDKSQLNVYITTATRDVLKAIHARDGVPYSAQIDRAVALWAKEKGIDHASKRGTR
jgi:hypothetical protein